jgi:hypothetical protein
MKIICFVLTTQKYLPRIQRVKNTWGRDIPTMFYSDHSDESNNIIKVTDNSDYYNTDTKQINIINMLSESYSHILNSYDWILFCDDDTFVNVNRLREDIIFFEYSCIYGNLLTYQRHPTNPIYNKPGIPSDLEYPSGGSGFCMSTSLIKTCGRLTDYKPGFSDVNLGLNAYYKNIPILHHIHFNGNTPELCNHDESKIKKAITYHYIVDDAKMQYLYDLTKV